MKYIKYFENYDSTDYLNQVETNSYIKITRHLYEFVSDEGFVDELENHFKKEFDQSDFEYTELNLSTDDKTGLINFDENVINKFNEFDIQLKEKYYPTICDFINYDKGEVYIIKLIP